MFLAFTLGNGKAAIGNRRRYSSDNKKIEKPPNWWKPGRFFRQIGRKSDQGEVHKEKTGADRSISEGVLTTSFGARRGGSLPPQNLTVKWTAFRIFSWNWGGAKGQK